MSKPLNETIADAMPPLSHLECSVCSRMEEIGEVADNLANGWPKCHGYTMMLITKKQVQEANQ